MLVCVANTIILIFYIYINESKWENMQIQFMQLIMYQTMLSNDLCANIENVDIYRYNK